MHVVRHLRCRTVPWPSVGRRVHGLAGDFMRRRFVADVQPLWGRGRCVGVPLHKSISSIRRALSTHVPSLGAVEVGSVVRAVRPNIRSVIGRSFLPEANDITHAVERCGGRGQIVEKGLRERDVAVAGTVYARPNVAHPPLSTDTTAAQDCVLGGGRACPCPCLRDSTGTTVIVIDVGDVRGGVLVRARDIDSGTKKARASPSDATTGFPGNTAGETGEAGVEGPGMGNRGERAEKDDDDGTTSTAADKINEGVGDRTRPRPAGGRKRKGGSSPRPPKKNNPWSLEERLDLTKFASEDDALMADAEGAQACMTRSKRWEWVAGRLGEIGYSRTAEDCRKKSAELVKKVREIRDACEGSGKQAYRDTTTEQRRMLGVSLTFERQLWDAMEWSRLKKSVTCDDTLASEDLRGGGSPIGGEAGSEGGGTDASDTATKTRRTSSGKARGGDSLASMYGMASVMEESTRALCEGLDKAASTLARASTDGSRMVATEIGAVAGAMRKGNAILEMLVGVMATRGARSGRGADDSCDTDPSTS
ncbi:hypothetical protein CBR_g51423 [Chara braunii]|uniref:Myb-like domain-containing protein n=1 Tax=Chara braunii TaxID=69332 RepID=A0A388K657_CHABU|nr:hypothetical protein CBR_g51423 [Chara braunii]|eukprot:GBG65540.1 hypothetical protein CBR_g51423 [Chara braunii]